MRTSAGILSPRRFGYLTRVELQFASVKKTPLSRAPMLNASSSKPFSRRLLKWYDANKRDLPWRDQPDPYRIWVSEIMLQQTRVTAVLDYYERFLKRFPAVRVLADAREPSVLAAWSGLGYYRRARMLHQAAKVVAREMHGVFPASSDELRKLPGVGRYTAAAVASIAFDEATAVVDGNVERVLHRLLGKQLSGEPLWAMANLLLETNRPGDHNQAMMELGATVCLPREPLCGQCPVVQFCRSRGKQPTSSRKPSPRRAIANYSLRLDKGAVFLTQRGQGKSLMPGMWELPELPQPRSGKPLLRLRHAITNTNYEVRVWRDTVGKSGIPIPKARVYSLPLTGLTRKILRKAGVI